MPLWQYVFYLLKHLLLKILLFIQYERLLFLFSVAKDYVRLMKYADSLYRCKQLKKAALGRYINFTFRVALTCIITCITHVLQTLLHIHVLYKSSLAH